MVIGGGSNNIIGGTSPAARNIISGNDTRRRSNYPAGGSGQQGCWRNLISGTFRDGTSALGNAEVSVWLVAGMYRTTRSGIGTAAGSNTIAFNGQDGVKILRTQDTGNRISRNCIFSNVGLGIDAERRTTSTNTDPGDVDLGANRLQNMPVITSAKNVSTRPRNGTLNSTAARPYNLIQFFSNPSGTRG